jgi:hypothetical protein
MTQNSLDGFCQAKKFEIRKIFSCEKSKKDLAARSVLSYSLRMDIFAIYRNQTVMLLGFEGNEALISFDDGAEKYVSMESLEILA